MLLRSVREAVRKPRNREGKSGEMIGSAIILAFFSTCLALGKDLPDDDNSRLVDLSWKASQNVVVAEGDADRYEGHPTTVSCGDGRVIAVWCSPHGGWCGHGAETADGGRTWSRIDDRFPDAFARHENCPSIYRLQGPDGRFRLWVFSQAKIASAAKPEPGVEPYRAFDGAEWMPRLMSEDEGRTWREMPALGSRFRCVMSFSSIVRLGDGSASVAGALPEQPFAAD